MLERSANSTHPQERAFPVSICTIMHQSTPLTGTNAGESEAIPDHDALNIEDDLPLALSNELNNAAESDLQSLQPQSVDDPDTEPITNNPSAAQNDADGDNNWWKHGLCVRIHWHPSSYRPDEMHTVDQYLAI